MRSRPRTRVQPVLLMVADDLAVAAGRVDQPGPPGRRAGAADRHQRVAAGELEGGEEVVLGAHGDRARGSAPNPRDVAAGEQAHQVEAVHAGVEQDAAARELGTIEPARAATARSAGSPPALAAARAPTGARAARVTTVFQRSVCAIRQGMPASTGRTHDRGRVGARRRERLLDQQRLPGGRGGLGDGPMQARRHDRDHARHRRDRRRGRASRRGSGRRARAPAPCRARRRGG